MTTIELLEQIRKDFVKEFDGDPQINRVCKVMINEYKLRSEALNLGVVSQQREQLFCGGCGHKKQFNIYTDINRGRSCKNQLCKQNNCG